MAAFAGVLDGRRLWVAVPAGPGRIGLRGADGAVLLLPGDTDDDQPGFTAARLDLAELPPPAPGAVGDDAVEAWDVVVASGRGRDARRVWSRPLTVGPSPVSPSLPHVHHALRRSDDGHLRLVRTAVPDAAHVMSLRILGDALELTLDADGAAVVLLDDDGGEVARYPVTDARATITADGVHDAAPQVTQVALAAANGSTRPVRRRANDLADPAAATLLPQVTHLDSDEPRLRLRWSGRGALQARIFEPEPARAEVAAS